LSSLGLWAAGNWLNLDIIGVLAGALSISFSLHIIVALFLINHYQMRGFYANYSAGVNKPLNRSVRRYRKRRDSEALHRLLLRYEVEGSFYYMTWYVPGVTAAVAASLGSGSEPLIFNHEGQWLDNEELFHKLVLMWSHGEELSPGTIPLSNRTLKNYRGLRDVSFRYLPQLPALMKLNESSFLEAGQGEDYYRVAEAYPAKCALFRNSLALLHGRITWADAYGWDSLFELRYEDVLRLHTAHVATIASRREFIDRHKLQAAEEAALRLVDSVRSGDHRLLGWNRRSDLERTLQVFSLQNPVGESRFQQDSTGEWRAPKESVDAYRSRLAYARQVDEEKATTKRAGSGLVG
jgi:hypothetical protein